MASSRQIACLPVCLQLVRLLLTSGHSLGEYAALSSVAQVLSVESLVDIVFLRGMTMQNAVERDESGEWHVMRDT